LKTQIILLSGTDGATRLLAIERPARQLQFLNRQFARIPESQIDAVVRYFSVNQFKRTRNVCLRLLQDSD
jgi:hypothetical protein